MRDGPDVPRLRELRERGRRRAPRGRRNQGRAELKPIRVGTKRSRGLLRWLLEGAGAGSNGRTGRASWIRKPAQRGLRRAGKLANSRSIRLNLGPWPSAANPAGFLPRFAQPKSCKGTKRRLFNRPERDRIPTAPRHFLAGAEMGDGVGESHAPAERRDPHGLQSRAIQLEERSSVNAAPYREEGDGRATSATSEARGSKRKVMTLEEIRDIHAKARVGDPTRDCVNVPAQSRRRKRKRSASDGYRSRGGAIQRGIDDPSVRSRVAPRRSSIDLRSWEMERCRPRRRLGGWYDQWFE